EPLHGHDWRVTVTVAGETLDDDGLLCDFHTIEEALEDIVRPFHNRNLNEVAPFDRLNPSAELVAKHIAERLSRL
ncbi:MAG TPA: 6-carboxytetrahydropterin synthase QueD, partial [Phycisphaerales bacterium]|nr:6-carboxytetrahydropterin synthase QueD [Phycisphaerales bacterium]